MSTKFVASRAVARLLQECGSPTTSRWFVAQKCCRGYAFVTEIRGLSRLHAQRRRLLMQRRLKYFWAWCKQTWNKSLIASKWCFTDNCFQDSNRASTALSHCLNLPTKSTSALNDAIHLLVLWADCPSWSYVRVSRLESVLIFSPKLPQRAPYNRNPARQKVRWQTELISCCFVDHTCT